MVVALKDGMSSRRRNELGTDNLSPHRLSSGWAACKTGETTTPLVIRPTEPKALRWGVVLAGGDGSMEYPQRGACALLNLQGRSGA
jgi:hypothetical protein